MGEREFKARAVAPPLTGSMGETGISIFVDMVWKGSSGLIDEPWEYRQGKT
jgi:hypothetical protein